MEAPEMKTSISVTLPGWCQNLNQYQLVQSQTATNLRLPLSTLSTSLMDNSLQREKLVKRKLVDPIICPQPTSKTRLLNGDLSNIHLKKCVSNLKNNQLKKSGTFTKNADLSVKVSTSTDCSASAHLLHSKSLELSVGNQLENRLLSKTLSHRLLPKSDNGSYTRNVLLEAKPLRSTYTYTYAAADQLCSVTVTNNSVQVKRDSEVTPAIAVKRIKSHIPADFMSEMPHYSFSLSQNVQKVKPVPNFDTAINSTIVETEARTLAKLALLHAVSSSLISGPNMKDCNDGIRLSILDRCKDVAEHSPEFVLKVALYSRNELNIRTTSNLLLAFSAYNTKCRCFLAKYFCASVRLPSDWLDVAEQYQLMHDEGLKPGSLPAALRRVMVLKFVDFDEYQLAKYNREKKKPKKPRGKKNAILIEDSEPSFFPEDFPAFLELQQEDSPPGNENIRKCYSEAAGGVVKDFEEADEEETDEYVERKFTLKQLVRLLHITRPAVHVMALVGKKYPSDLEKFRASGLLGYWEEERADKRMKLPTPETWETQVSLKGNKASTWKALIDNRKLPFMAMLRNLRNMILAGISEKHHAEILKILTNERAVENSRQFPFRFLSAYEVLNDLEKKYLTQDQTDAGRTSGKKSFSKRKFQSEKKPSKKCQYNIEILNRYRSALNEAIRLATMLNVPPIPGTTIVLLDVNRYTNVPCTSARGLGKPRTVQEVALLLGLMCQAACENSVCILYAKDAYQIIEPANVALLERISHLKTEAEKMTEGDRYDVEADKCDSLASHSTEAFLDQLLHDRVQVNNLLVLSNCITLNNFAKFLPLYRELVNPNLLFVSVDLSAKSARPSPNNDHSSHSNNVWLSGFSDQLLRFVAERGSSQQLDHVEAVDIKYNLTTQSHSPVEEFLASRKSSDALHQPGIRQPRWRSVRIFISSTFRDMHGERDLLVRYIFPELREKARSLFLDVHEVDLRWGITEHEAEENKALQVCLEESSRCHIFIGLIGERYGYIPDLTDIPLSEEFDWVRQYPPGASITELEFYAGALSKSASSSPTAFIYMRDNSFLKSVPSNWKNDFIAETVEAQDKVNILKKKVLQSPVSVYNGYACQWGGVVGGRPIVSGLEKLGQKILQDIWQCLVHFSSNDDSTIADDLLSKDTMAQNMAVERHCSTFVGRKQLVEQFVDAVAEKKMALIILSGKAGSGKTATMAHLLKKLQGSLNVPVVGYFVNATPNSNSVGSMLRYLCQELCLQLKKTLTTLPEASDSRITAEFFQLLNACIKQSGRLVLVIDNLDGLDSDSMLTWMPDPLPQGLIFIGSVTHGAVVQKTLILRDATFFSIQPLSLPERSLVVKQTLAPYRKVLTDSLINNQLRLLVSKSEAGRPLYLYMASKQLRMHGSYAQMTTMLQQLPPTLDGLLKMRMNHLNQLYGTELVSVVLGLLSNAKDGLLQEELWGLVCLYWSLRESPVTIGQIRTTWENPDTMLPPVLFVQLIRDLDGLLAPVPDGIEPVLSLSHAEVTKLVRTYYKQDKTVLNDAALHTLLAGFFLNEADPERNYTWLGQSPRPFARIIYHLLAAGCHQESVSILIDLQFLHAKSRLGIANTLLEEFNAVQSITGLKTDKSSLFNFDQYQQFVARSHHILTSCPTLLMQQALNEPSSSAPAIDSERLLGSNVFPSALKWFNKPKKNNMCMETILHSEPVTSVAVSSREPWIAFGMQSGSIHLYNTKSGKEGFVFNGHTDLVSRLTFVGAFRLCSASNDGTLSLWDLQTGNRVAVMKGHRRRVSGCCCDTDVTVIVSVSWDCTLRTWHPRSGQDISTMKEKQPINCVSLHPHRLAAAIGLWDCTVRLWDLQSVKRKAILRGHTASVKCLSFSPCGDYIVSASLNGEVRIWSSSAGFQINAFESHKVAINDVLFVKGGTGVVTVSDDHSLKVWESVFGSKRTVFRCDTNSKVISLAFCNNGDSLLVADNKSQLTNVNFQTGFVNYTVKPSTAYVTAMSSDMDMGWILIGYSSGELKVVRCESGATLANLQGSEEAVTSLLSRKSAVLAGTAGGLLLVYNLPSKLLSRNCCDVKFATSVKAHFGQVTCIVANKEEKLFASMSRDKAVKVWSASGNKKEVDISLVASYEACHSDWINAGAWINDKKKTYLVTGSNDCTLKLWNFDCKKKSLNEVKILSNMPGPIIHISVWDSNIVSGSLDGTIHMVTKKGAKVLSLSGEPSKCFAAVSTDAPVQSKDWYERVIAEELGTDSEKKQQPWPQVVMAVACDGGLVKCAQLLDEKHGQTLSGHSDCVLSAANLWDGQLVSCSRDHTARVWQCDSDTNDLLTVTHKAAVTAVDWCRPLQFMLSTDESGTLVLWNKSPASLIPSPKTSVLAHSKSVTGACFTFHEHDNVGLCTVSTDGYLALWSWDGVNIPKKGFRINSHAPLACVCYLPSRKIVAAGGWNGVTVICNASSGEVLNISRNNEVEWFLKVTFNLNDKLVWASYKGIIQGTNNCAVEVREMDLGKFRMDSEPVVQLESELILPTCLNVVPSLPSNPVASFFLGITNGEVVQQSRAAYNMTGPRQFQMHKSDLIACEYITEHNFLLTASQDSLLKLWQLLQDGSFCQVAQYECRAPVTCLTVLETEALTVACGDSHGHLDFIQWLGFAAVESWLLHKFMLVPTIRKVLL